MNTDSITIIRARNRRLAKLVHGDGRIDGYDSARTFDLASHPLDGLAVLADLLAALLPQRDAAVVRGDILDVNHARGVRRLLYRDAKTGDVPTLRDVPRWWLALDMEGIARPPDVPAHDLRACARLALAALPVAFSDAACIVQASGSHGFKPDLRMRLWYWCSRPVGGGALKRWLRRTPVDPCVFGAAQPIYTAAPIMLDGRPDPLPTRILVLPGKPDLRVPSVEELAPRPRIAESKRPQTSGLTNYARAALDNAERRIKHATKRHPAIVAECRSLARLVHGGVLHERDMRLAVARAAQAAGKDDADEIERCISWGLANPSSGSAGGPHRA